MNCLFCKEPSTNTIGVEHIIPQSLGNIDITLPKGFVCDKCNQYFSTKVEKPLLESEFFLHSRFRNQVPSKKGRIPSISAVMMPNQIELDYFIDKNGKKSIAVKKEKDEKQYIDYIQSNNSGHMYINTVPDIPDLSDKIISRFLSKIAVEALAHRLKDKEGALQYLVDDSQLDPIRKYARYAEGVSFWPFNARRIYSEDKCFSDERGTDFEVLHEFDLLYTEEKELYLVCAIFGVEYVINYASTELYGYHQWLKSNNNRSPLY